MRQKYLFKLGVHESDTVGIELYHRLTARALAVKLIKNGKGTILEGDIADMVSVPALEIRVI